MTATVPCSTCPWRRSSSVGGADIPNFDIDLMRGLRATVGPDDAFRRVMALTGRIDMAAIGEACKDMDLWPSFRAMLAAYEAAYEAAR